MKTTQFQDELTGSEYADIEAFEDLKVRFTVDQRILVPQLFDSPYRRVVGRGLPFNPLGVVALPISVLPEGLRGLVQEDGLMDEVAKLVAAERITLAKLPENGDVEMSVLEAKAKETIGKFCVAAPGPEGIEVDGGPYSVREMALEMRYRNKPEDLLFLGREIEVELSGVRSERIKSAIDLKAKPYRSGGEKRHTTARGYGMSHERMMQQAMRSRCVPQIRVTHDEIDFTGADYAGIELRTLSWLANTDARRQKFALTATKITLV